MASPGNSIEEACYRGNEGEQDDWRTKSFHFSSPVKEKQISVDPVSLKQPPPPFLPPPVAKPKFTSGSLPCSGTSSPESGSSLPKSFKKWSNSSNLPQPAFHPSFSRHCSSMQSQFDNNRRGMLFPRSKSCGDGRSSQPSDDFDMLCGRPKAQTATYTSVNEITPKVREETQSPECKEDEGFKCGVMCLFLPGLAKKKQVQLRRQPSRELEDGEEEEDDYNEHDDRDDDDDDIEKEVNRSCVLSRVASLEKFECASWSSATILDDIEDEGINAYFDLPLELIRGSTDEAYSPVKTAFVFERERKGVLKKSTSRVGARKSHESSNRHVRFSTSTPVSYPPSPTSSSVTPRLFQAREEFSAALLEAQNAHINF